MTLNQVIKKAAAWGLSKTGIAAAKRKTARSKVVILAYRRVISSTESIDDYPTGSVIKGDIFYDHLQFLKRNFDVIALRTFCTKFLTGQRFEKPTAILTFDDALMETYDRAAPMLEDANLPATLLVPTAAVGTYGRLWRDMAGIVGRDILGRRKDLRASFPDENMPESCRFIIDMLITKFNGRKFIDKMIEKVQLIQAPDRPDALEWLAWLGKSDLESKPEHMTWSHVADLCERGWDPGSATVTGHALSDSGSTAVEAELAGSFRTIQDKLGRAPIALAYPEGVYDELTVRHAKKVGYPCALTLSPAFADVTKDLFTLPRITVNQETAPTVPTFENLLSFG